MSEAAQNELRPFASAREAASWIKLALSCWVKDKSASAFVPFEGAFKPALELHEVLYAIYLRLDRPGRDWQAAKGNFRAGAAALIGEPEVTTWNPTAAIELVRLGGRLASLEILKASTELMRAANLATADDPSHTSASLLIADLYHNVVAANFVGKSMVAFLEACKRHTLDQSLNANSLLLNLVRHDRTNWARHAITLSHPLYQSYIDLKAVGSSDLIHGFFADDLIEALDRSSIDFQTILLRGLREIRQSREFGRLQFLLSLPAIGRALNQFAENTVKPIRLDAPVRPESANGYAGYMGIQSTLELV